MPSTIGTPATPTRILDQSAVIRAPRPRPPSIAALPAAEPAAALRIGGEGGAKLAGAEVGPQRVDEHELGVRELPEEEVRDPELAARPDQQVGIGKVRRMEVRRDHVLVDLPRLDAAVDQPARGLDQLGAAAVVERYPEAERRIELGPVLHRLHPHEEGGRGAVTAADEADANTLLREVRKLALDRLAEDLH